MIAQNNIFNIRAGQSWIGAEGATRGFCNFVSVDYCIRAWLVLMRTYRRKYFCCTIRQIVERFAPPTENPTSSYISYICNECGIPEDFALSNDTYYYEIAKAMAYFETNYKLPTYRVKLAAKRFNIAIVPNAR